MQTVATVTPATSRPPTPKPRIAPLGAERLGTGLGRTTRWYPGNPEQAAEICRALGEELEKTLTQATSDWPELHRQTLEAMERVTPRLAPAALAALTSLTPNDRTEGTIRQRMAAQLAHATDLLWYTGERNHPGDPNGAVAGMRMQTELWLHRTILNRIHDAVPIDGVAGTPEENLYAELRLIPGTVIQATQTAYDRLAFQRWYRRTRAHVTSMRRMESMEADPNCREPAPGSAGARHGLTLSVHRLMQAATNENLRRNVQGVLEDASATLLPTDG